MIMRETFLCLLLSLFITVCFGSACVPAQCLKCNYTEETVAESCPRCSANCINVSLVHPGCKKDFPVSINSTRSKVQEGDSINLTCVHKLHNVTLMFGWEMNGVELPEGQNKIWLFIKTLRSAHNGRYSCFVNSSCGFFKSLPYNLDVPKQTDVLLIICGVSALALVLLMGIIMKFKLKRDNAQHRERMKQREQNNQGTTPAPLAPESPNQETLDRI